MRHQPRTFLWTENCSKNFQGSMENIKYEIRKMYLKVNSLNNVLIFRTNLVLILYQVLQCNNYIEQSLVRIDMSFLGMKLQYTNTM